MRSIKELFKWFIYISAGILVVSAVSFEAYGLEALPKDTLWQILISGAVTALATWILCPEDEDRGRVTAIRMVLHYLALCVIMTILGKRFGWAPPGIAGVIIMAIDVALVYAICFGTYYLFDRKQAEDINKKLKEKYDEKE